MILREISTLDALYIQELISGLMDMPLIPRFSEVQTFRGAYTFRSSPVKIRVTYRQGSVDAYYRAVGLTRRLTTLCAFEAQRHAGRPKQPFEPRYLPPELLGALAVVGGRWGAWRPSPSEPGSPRRRRRTRPSAAGAKMKDERKEEAPSWRLAASTCSSSLGENWKTEATSGTAVACAASPPSAYLKTGSCGNSERRRRLAAPNLPGRKSATFAFSRDAAPGRLGQACLQRLSGAGGADRARRGPPACAPHEQRVRRGRRSARGRGRRRRGEGRVVVASGAPSPRAPTAASAASARVARAERNSASDAFRRQGSLSHPAVALVTFVAPTALWARGKHDDS